MAEQDITMKFEGTGDLLPFLKEIRANVNGLRDDSGKAQASIQADLKNSAQSAKEFTAAVSTSATTAANFGKGAAAGLDQVDKSLAKTTAGAKSFAGALTDVERVALKGTNDALKQIAQQQGIVIGQAEEHKVAAIDTLVAMKGLTKEEGEILKETAAITEAFDTAFNGLNEGVETAETLRGKLQRAKDEAFAIGEKFGTGSAQFAAAAAKAGKIADEIDHINKVVDAFNPGKKLAAVLQLGEGAVGAFTAINAVVSAIGGDSEETEKALKRVEQGVGFLIGAQSAIRGFTEGWASLKAIIGSVTEVEVVNETVTNAVAIAQQKAAAAFEANKAAAIATQVAIEAETAAEIASAEAKEALLSAQAAGLSIEEATIATKEQQVIATNAAAVAQERQAAATQLGAVATAESVVATEADVAAKSAQSAASTIATGATKTLTTAVALFNATLLANPIIAVVAAIGLLITSIYLLATSEEEATIDADKLLDKLKEIQGIDLQDIDFGKRLDLLDSEAEALKRGNTAEAERAKIVSHSLIEQQARADKLLVLAKERAAVEEGINTLIPKLETGDITKEQLEQLRKLQVARKEFDDEREKIEQDAVVATKERDLELAKFDATEKEKEVTRERNTAKAIQAIREQLADQIAAIEKQLADKIRELQLSGADPRERLKLEREAGEEGIALLEKNLRREIALREIGAAKLIDLSEKEKNALADARIAEGGGKLSTKNDQDFANARLLIWTDYFRKVSDLQAEFDQTLADATGDAQTRELAELDKLLAERAKKLKDAGATPAQIEEDAQRQTLIVQTKFAKDRIDRETQTQVDILEAQLNGGELSVAQERALQIAILQEKIKGAEKALAIIEDNGSDIAKAEIASAKNVIAKLKGELRNLTDDIKPFKLSDLFNLEGDDAARFNDAAKSLVASAFDIVGQLNAAEQARIDAQIDATDQLIEDYQRRGDELQAQLEKDQEANAKGLANNLNGTLNAIADNKAAEEKALADKKRLVAEKQKLAKQQAIADTIQQSSSLLTAATSIFKEGALVPGGIFVAIGIVASMVASFLALKNKMASITAQPLWKGTKSVELNGAPDGVDTVPAMLTRRERVIDVETSDRHRTLYDGLQDKDASAVRRGLLQTADQYGLTPDLVGDAIANLTPKQLAPILAQIDLTPLLAEHGITVREESVRSVVTMNSTHKERIEKAQAVSMAGMERRLDVLTAEVKLFRKQEADRPEAFTLPDGTLMIETPHMVRYIAPHR